MVKHLNITTSLSSFKCQQAHCAFSAFSFAQQNKMFPLLAAEVSEIGQLTLAPTNVQPQHQTAINSTPSDKKLAIRGINSL